MDTEYRRDIGDDVDLHVPESTQDDSSTMSMDCGLSVDVPTYCYEECNIISSVKTEEEQSESVQEDSTSRLQSSLDAFHSSASEESVKCEEEPQDFGAHELPFKDTGDGGTWPHDGDDISVKHELKVDSGEYDRNSKETRHWFVCGNSASEESVKCEEEPQDFGAHELPFKDTGDGGTWPHDGDDISVKHELKVDSGEYDRNSKETRHWFVCGNGLLETVRTYCNNGREKGAGDCSENDDHRRQQSCCATTTTKDTNVSRRKNRLKVREDKTPTCLRSFVCSTCGKKFSHADPLRVHIRRHAAVKPFSCATCEKTFVTSWDLKVHKRTHTGVKPYKCTTCGKTFATSSNRSKHERSHAGVKPFMCATCGKRFKSSIDLELHESANTCVRPFVCTTCGNTFLRSSNLIVHERTHTGVKSFVCTTCGKAFAHSSSLKVHEIVHSGVKSFVCKTCGRAFALSSTLGVHEKTHSGVRRFTCATCGQAFITSSNLIIHERKHSGVKPFHCSTCGIGFIQSSSLKRHEKAHSCEIFHS